MIFSVQERHRDIHSNSLLPIQTHPWLDRMMEVFDLVLVIDSNERFPLVRAPIQAEMNRQRAERMRERVLRLLLPF